ncbi:MAG: hypothetical protein ACLP5H_29760 [Desulfomonilaceae bacterium]
MTRSKINHHYVSVLIDLLSNGNGKTEQAVRFLKMVIADRMWKCRFARELGRNVRFDSLEEFVHARPPEGLGTTVQKLKDLCIHDEHVAKLIDRELCGKVLSKDL